MPHTQNTNELYKIKRQEDLVQELELELIQKEQAAVEVKRKVDQAKMNLMTMKVKGRLSSGGLEAAEKDQLEQVQEAEVLTADAGDAEMRPVLVPAKGLDECQKSDSQKGGWVRRIQRKIRHWNYEKEEELKSNKNRHHVLSNALSTYIAIPALVLGDVLLPFVKYTNDKEASLVLAIMIVFNMVMIPVFMHSLWETWCAKRVEKRMKSERSTEEKLMIQKETIQEALSSHVKGRLMSKLKSKPMELEAHALQEMTVAAPHHSKGVHK